MNRLTLVPLGAFALSWAAGCAQAECSEDFDCGIGNSCSVDGTCAMAAPIRRGEIADAIAGQDFNPIVDSGVTEGGVYDGNIGPSAQVAGPADVAWDVSESGAGSIRVGLPDLQGTVFVALYLADMAALEQPGQLVFAELAAAGDLGMWWSQGCNYKDTETAYDEVLTDVVIDVAEPDGDGVILLDVTVDGEGTDGTARVPWTPPAQR
jgi:hypothetical protein